MGFTIDMVSGEILDETLTQNSEKVLPNNYSNDIPEFDYSERLESVVESVSESHVGITMPESLSQINIDVFIDQIS